MKKRLYLLIIILFLLSFFLWQERQRFKKSNFILKNELSEVYRYMEHIQKSYYQEGEKVSVESESDLRGLIKDYSAHSSRQESGVQDVISKEDIAMRQLPTFVPVKGEYAVSQKFTSTHQGLDLAAELGKEVIASALGMVISVYHHQHLGNVVEINHLNGYQTNYAHLALAIVESGQLVKQGEVIGFIGNTGRSTAPHLHFEVKKDGSLIDPMELLRIE